MTKSMTRRVRATMILLALSAASALTTAAGGAQAMPIGPGCPALYVLGVQGTGQSSPAADPVADTGVLGTMLAPVTAAVPGLVQHSYIAYGAGFGGIVPGGGAAPYAASVADAHNQLATAAAQVIEQCPGTLIAGVAYSQGAQALAQFAQEVGAGVGSVPADKIAAIALYSNPIRVEGSPTFPGRPGQTVPDPAPGTRGAAVSGVQVISGAAGGSGIASTGAGYGALEGRVADVCVDGDLACSAPDQAALLRLGAEIAARANLADPISAVASINALLSQALGDAWTTVINNDIQVGGGNVDYAPQQPLSVRLIDAADPRIPAPTPEDAGAAAARWNEITATIVGNPVVLLPKVVGQLSAAWGQLLADNAALTNPSVWLHFADTVARHNGYAATGQLTSGTAWLTALAHDLGSR
ncbi:cutinase family protein [Nocardia sp. CA-120079]|uniref:cutinase family protein n=1 Tax=Nocardia sp. CA-120079 TaxID=3239974 RepID=UPI003D983FA7